MGERNSGCSFPASRGPQKLREDPRMLLLPLGTPQLSSPTLRSISLVRDGVMNQAVSPGTRELVGDCDQPEGAGDFCLRVPAHPPANSRSPQSPQLKTRESFHAIPKVPPPTNLMLMTLDSVVRLSQPVSLEKKSLHHVHLHTRPPSVRPELVMRA